MSTDPHPRRAGRSSASPAGVLVVGCGRTTQRVQEVLRQSDRGQPVETVPDFLMALGHIASRPPAVLIGHLDDIEGPCQVTAEALRRLAPETRLMLVAPRSRREEACRAVDAGFDDYLLEPVDPGELIRAATTAATPPPRAASGPPAQPIGDAAAGPDRAVEAALKRPARPDRPSAASAGPSAIEPFGEGPPLTAADPARALGDIDLVEDLLHSRSQFRHTAMRLITQHARVNGIKLAQTVDAAPPGHRVVPVVFADRVLGALHAPSPATSAQIEPWASWLGRWLALERKVRRLRALALRDELTGLWNRRYFNHFLKKTLRWAAGEDFQVTLMLFDIDDFKQYNDRFGHGAGDEILRETARLMRSVVREHDVVARIGGDEFAVIFWDADPLRMPGGIHPHDVRDAARRFRKAIQSHRFPKLGDEAPGTLTISGGLAGFPADGQTPEELLELADRMAIRSKQQGKNAITFGPGAHHGGVFEKEDE